MAEVDDEEGVVLLLHVVLSDGNTAGIYRLDPMWEHAPPQPTGSPVSVAAQDAMTSLPELVEPIGEPSLEVAKLLVSVTKQGQSVTSLPLFPVLADEDGTKRALSQGDSGFSLVINPIAGRVVARFHQIKGSQRKWISTGVYSLSMMSVEDDMPCISIEQLVGKQITDFYSQETLDVQFPPFRLNFEKHFRREKRLGKGTEGVVYQCSARFSQHRCAVKKIIPEDLYMKSDREPSDVNNMAMLSHTNIAQLYFAWADVDKQNFGQVLEATYICMEMCATSLMHYLEGKAEVDLGTAYRIFRQLMTGLEYMHQQDVVHRDIKPANILITKNLGIKIADLGISIRKQRPYILNFHGGMYGSKPYRAPEIINLYVRHDEKVDIFAAGMIYYELFMPGVEQRSHKLKILSKLIREGMETSDQLGEKFDLDSILDGTNILSGWKGEYCILKRMLVPNHRERPSATEILAMLEAFPDAVLTDEGA